MRVVLGRGDLGALRPGLGGLTRRLWACLVGLGLGYGFANPNPNYRYTTLIRTLKGSTTVAVGGRCGLSEACRADCGGAGGAGGTRGGSLGDAQAWCADCGRAGGAGAGAGAAGANGTDPDGTDGAGAGARCSRACSSRVSAAGEGAEVTATAPPHRRLSLSARAERATSRRAEAGRPESGRS